MSSSSHALQVSPVSFREPVAGMMDADRSVLSELDAEKWPVWLRLLTIVGLSAGLWGAIIWAFVSIFG